ncbi:serine hydrolase domain-containing protein [Cytophagaceae bacterium YF14B1]|uniref:Serine hydrolase domain-containing protein n=1 Tax=Xanthocytophaga flava TaxID=3048013 RepID=A0AAE3QYG0_9BACT|nr:serine hydrolase domain-containing protein [Xanthocytophaga flavus]MDJ1485485.1 serine hydrolase domain-containing protein [Xanthocytophaga flavus]
MNIRYFYTILLSLWLLFPACNKYDADIGNYKYGVSSWQGTNVYSERYRGAIERARKIVTESNRGIGLPGAQVAIAVDGQICWSENFGFSDLSKGTLVNSTTIFRIASVSKLFTASALGKLIEKGKIHLDSTITYYLPDLPEHYSHITIRHLVSHQSGIRHYYGADKSEKTEHYTHVEDALRLFSNAPLLFPAGQKCEYSSYNFSIVSAIIQRVSGKSFLKYLQDEIWIPAGLKNTFGEIPVNRIKDITKFYIKSSSDASWVDASFQDLSFNWGGAGLSSNANDLVLFGNALLTNKLFSKETMRMMCTPQLTSQKDTTGFGIGFILYETADNEVIIGHGGFMPTAKAYILLFPESNLVIAFTSNTAMVNFADETLVEIAHIFLKEKKDENHFLFNRMLNQRWTGLWQIKIENGEEKYDNAYLYFYEVSNMLKGSIFFDNREPVPFEITDLKEDSIQLIAPLRSHTAMIQLVLKNGNISGKSYYNKPLTYLFKKQLSTEPELAKMLKPKNMRDGIRVN